MAVPLATGCAVFPEQILGDVTFTVGDGLTVTVATAVAVHPVVPVTVYVVVVVNTGVVTLAVLPIFGLQLYVVAPSAIKVAVVPEQILGEFTVTTGGAVTVTVATADLVQPFAVPVTVYVVVVVKAGVVTLAVPPILGLQV